MEKIVMTEDQFVVLYSDLFITPSGRFVRGDIYDSIIIAKQKGYIKKSDLEIAEEKIRHTKYRYGSDKNNDTWADKAINLIEKQSKEIMKLRGEE